MLEVVDRTPMIGASGRRYIVAGEKEFSAWDAVTGPFFRLIACSPGRYPFIATIPHEGRSRLYKFWDVDAGIEAIVNPCLSSNEALSMARQVVRNQSHWMLFQCEAGMCRSAGLCVAVARFFGDDEVAEECYRRYAPNELVVERLTDAFAGLIRGGG